MQDFYVDQIVTHISDNERLRNEMETLQEDNHLLRQAAVELKEELIASQEHAGAAGVPEGLPGVPTVEGLDLPAVPLPVDGSGRALGVGGVSDDLWDEINDLTDKLAEKDRLLQNA